MSPNQSHNNDAENNEDVAVIVENPGQDIGIGTRR